MSLRLKLFFVLAAIVAVLLMCVPPNPFATLEKPVAMYEVESAHLIMTIQEWEGTPWARPGDLTTETPVYFWLSRERWACRVTAAEWAVAPLYQRVPCKTGWRRPRNR